MNDLELAYACYYIMNVSAIIFMFRYGGGHLRVNVIMMLNGLEAYTKHTSHTNALSSLSYGNSNLVTC